MRITSHIFQGSKTWGNESYVEKKRIEWFWLKATGSSEGNRKLTKHCSVFSSWKDEKILEWWLNS